MSANAPSPQEPPRRGAGTAPTGKSLVPPPSSTQANTPTFSPVQRTTTAEEGHTNMQMTQYLLPTSVGMLQGGLPARTATTTETHASAEGNPTIPAATTNNPPALAPAPPSRSASSLSKSSYLVEGEELKTASSSVAPATLAQPQAPPQPQLQCPTVSRPVAGMTITTTRVITMQPCKIVYYYTDNTSCTYLLEQQEQPSPQPALAGRDGPLTSPPPRSTLAQPAETVVRPLSSVHTHRRGHRDSGHGSNSGAYCNHHSHRWHHPPAESPTRIPVSHGGRSASLSSFHSDDSSSSSSSTRTRRSDNDRTRDRYYEGRKRTRKNLAVTQTLATPLPCPSCGHGACLAAVYKPPEYVAAITPLNPRIGSPGPVTLFAFGFTTCLWNVHQAGICPLNLTTMGLICFYGGLAQFVGGFFELMNKNTIFCTLDVTYGGFWMATAVTNLLPANENVVAEAPKNYMGGFFMLWFFFAATMLASSLKFSYVQILLNFAVTLNFLLNFLGYFINSTTLLHVAGFEGIVVGCLATYVGMAFTMRDIYGYSVLPLFFQKNFRITEW